MGIGVPSAEYFDKGQWGFDGSVWRKLPLTFGYTDRYAEDVAENNVAAGDVEVDFSEVPAGEIWVVTAFAAYGHQSNCSRVYLGLYDGATFYRVAAAPTPTAFVTIEMSGSIVLKAGDLLRAWFIGATLNDDFRAYAVGYKMAVT